MSLTFSSPKLNELASKPFLFENWMAFREGFLNLPVLPACYDLPSFGNEQDFKKNVHIVLKDRVLLSIRNGREIDFDKLLQLITAWIANIERGTFLTIGEFLDAFPMFVLV